ncbi:MAG TPA: hypothetical protein VKP65_08725 [Rhodothermales bacterium]|nr:hypothetical protein [Rhodothermales bacterium]
MASSSQGLRTAIQVLLAIVIIALFYWLYVSITAPYAAVERAQEITDMTRERMEKVRTSLITYERREDDFPSTLDSLMLWVRSDSFMVANRDSLLGTELSLDSLTYSPRTGNRFLYSVNDTGRVAIYLLKDPDSEDYLGSELSDVTQLNAASWE